MYSGFPLHELPDAHAVKWAYKSIRGGICFPNGITVEKLTDLVCDYVGTHPDDRQYAGLGQIDRAVEAAYPCPKGQ